MWIIKKKYDVLDVMIYRKSNSDKMRCQDIKKKRFSGHNCQLPLVKDIFYLKIRVSNVVC